MSALREKIISVIKSDPTDASGYEDLLSYCMDEHTEFEEAHTVNKELRGLINEAFPMGMTNNNRDRIFDVYKQSLLFDAPHFFEPYLLYLEIDREPRDRFYQPRRKRLKVLVDAMQDLLDDKLDELFISMPPRVGKTSLVAFFTSFIIGRNSDWSNLYSAFSSTITDSFYNAVMEIITDPYTYKWKEIFPQAKLVQTNGKDTTLNIDRKKHYPSLTCRSLYGTLNGACDCNGILIADDLIGGIEEALNKDRLVSAWTKVDNNLIPRAKMQAKMFWIGTRWSVADPIGVRLDTLENEEAYANRRWRVIDLPALDENDESCFDYDFRVGFSTEYYHQRRASFERNNDTASWLAQYMQQPIEREGTLFAAGDFRYYNGTLPDCDPDRIFMALDPAYGGGDFTAGAVCFKYGYDIYVHDVIFNDGDKRVTQPEVVAKIEHYGIKALQVEGTKSTAGYKEDIDKMLKDKGVRINSILKPAPNNLSKCDKIYDHAPDIRERMIFREDGARSKEYQLFMQNVFSFRMFKKKQHDDAPDVLSQAIEMDTAIGRKVEIFKRPF